MLNQHLNTLDLKKKIKIHAEFSENLTQMSKVRNISGSVP